MSTEQRIKDLKQCGLSTREAEAQARHEQPNEKAELQDALRRMVATAHLPNQHPDRIAACSHARQLLAKVAR